MATSRLTCHVCQYSVLSSRHTRSFYSTKQYIISRPNISKFRRKAFPSPVVRWYSAGGSGRTPPSGGFIKNFVENLRKSLEKDKKMHENLKAFEDERSRVVKSDSVKLLKQKASDMKDFLVTVTLKVIDYTRSGTTRARRSISSSYSEVMKSDVGKKSQEVGSQVSKSAQEAAQKISEKAKVIGETDIYRTVSKGAEAVKEDLLDDIIKESGPYKPPEEILKRTDRASIIPGSESEETLKADDKTKDLVVTRRGKWKQKWNSFRENNPVSNLFYSARMKYDESDHLVVRASRSVTDKVGDMFGGVVTQSDMAETLAEIYKIDPKFDKEKFVKECQFEIVPTILEAYLQGRQDILKDWCHEGAYNVLCATIKQNKTNKTAEHRVLEVRDVDIIGAKLLEAGPVMVLAFNAQQLTRTGGTGGDTLQELMENVFYVWALCRDQTIYDPKVAWRVMEFGIQSSGKLLI